MGRITLTIAVPAVAYIRGPSPSPIHEESTLFPTGLRSPVLSPLLPFSLLFSSFLFFSFHFFFFLALLASSTTAATLDFKCNRDRSSPLIFRAEREFVCLLFRNWPSHAASLSSLLFIIIPAFSSSSFRRMNRDSAIILLCLFIERAIFRRE